MTQLKKGDRGPLVIILQEDLNAAGYQVGVVDGIFGVITERAVRAFQAAEKLTVDGIAGPRTRDALARKLDAVDPASNKVLEVIHRLGMTPAREPVTALDSRINEALHLQQRCDGGQGCRYGGWINPYQFDTPEFDAKKAFVIPLVGKIVPGAPLTKPIHGGTCSPWAGLMLGWYLCANEDYNFRIGRSAYEIANFNYDQIYKNSRIPGYAQYCEVEGKYRLEKHSLSDLYGHWEWLTKVNFVEMDHHCILVLKVGGPNGLNLRDPRVGGPHEGPALAPGLYRWGADGFYPKKDIDGDGVPEKFYSGTRQTFRLIEDGESTGQAWDVYRVTDLDPVACSPIAGPWRGRVPWKLTLE